MSRHAWTLSNIAGADRMAFAGFTLVEVMIAVAVLSIGLLGGVSTLHWTDRSLHRSFTASRVLSVVEARLEAKRAGLWEQLLNDDLDNDGIAEIVMQDNGARADLSAGDGLYTGEAEVDGIQLIWTVEPNRAGPLASAGLAWIEVRARYEANPGQWREIRLRTIRANPRYIGGS
jgi:prepilin-type N-terminal cleavage/methylation domain-containing protein